MTYVVVIVMWLAGMAPVSGVRMDNPQFSVGRVPVVHMQGGFSVPRRHHGR